MPARRTVLVEKISLRRLLIKNFYPLEVFGLTLKITH